MIDLQTNFDNAETKRVKIDSVKLWKENPRIITEKEVKILAEEIRPYGQITPLVVFTKDNQIRKGNRTWCALKYLDYKEVEVKYIDFGNSSIANAYGIMDNKSSDSGKWNKELLEGILTAQSFNSFQDMTGFSLKEIDKLSLEPMPKKKSLNITLSIKEIKSVKEKYKIIIFLQNWIKNNNIIGIIK
jgi:hypothetical protein